MTLEATAVNIICPHCKKDSYQRISLDQSGAQLIGCREITKLKCSNCKNEFTARIDASIRTEKH